MFELKQILQFLFIILIIIYVVNFYKIKETFHTGESLIKLNEKLLKNVDDAQKIIDHDTEDQVINYVPHLDILKSYKKNLTDTLLIQNESSDYNLYDGRVKVNNIKNSIVDLKKKLKDKMIETELNKDYKTIKSYNNGQELSILKKNINDYMIKLNNGCLKVNKNNNYEVVACNDEDINQKFKIKPIYNKPEYINNLDKNTPRISNLDEIKYPFTLIKAKSNNNCLKNFHGKLSVEPCRESVGQMWQPLIKTNNCKTE